MNLFFILSGGAFIALLADYYQLSSVSFRSLFLYSATTLLILYSAKYITLQFAGWVFNVSAAIDHYIFIVYLIFPMNQKNRKIFVGNRRGNPVIIRLRQSV